MWSPTTRIPECERGQWSLPSPYVPPNTVALRKEWARAGEYVANREDEPEGTLQEALAEYLARPGKIQFLIMWLAAMIMLRPKKKGK